jgi:plasmid stabilization system protein ParE
MTVEFTNRAVVDLRKISNHSRSEFGDRVTAALEVRIREVIDNIFYKVSADRVGILHIRHTARQPWTG